MSSFQPCTKTPSMSSRALVCLAVFLASFFALTSVQAGEGHKKCQAETQACLDKMASKLQSKAWLGIETERLESGWYQITGVDTGSPAAEAGLRAGDVLIKLNGVKIHADNKKALKKAKKALAPGVVANYVVKRDGNKQQVAVALAHIPEERIAQYLGQHLLDHHATERIALVH